MTDGHCDHCTDGCVGSGPGRPGWHTAGDTPKGGAWWIADHCPVCAERARIWEEAFRRADSTNDRGAQWALSTFARWVRGDK